MNSHSSFLRIFLLIALSLMISSGCSKNLGVPDTQLLENELPDDYRFRANIDEVWKCVCKHQEQSASNTVLVKSADDHVISWCENASNCRDLSDDTIRPHPSMIMTSPNKYKKHAIRPREGQAITTIWIKDSGSGCEMRIRRVYHSPKSFDELGHSRGDYEGDFVQKLKTCLGEV